MAALDETGLPVLGSAELELLFKLDDGTEGGPYQMLEKPAAWALDPSPAGSGDPLFGVPGMSSLPALAAMPAYYTLDPLLGGSGSLPPGFLPLADAGPDSFMPPLHSNSSQGAASSGMDSGSAGTGGPAAGIAAAAVVTSGRRGKAGGGGGGAGGKKELTEEQKERIKAKNRRAQNRYREKQKQKSAAAEQEFANTQRELERLRLENSALQERQSTMQQVLSVREEWMGSLEEGKAAADKEAAAPLPCGCPRLAECSCLAAPALTAAQQAASKLELAHRLDVSAGPSCPLTGLTLSQIAELKRSPPEALQRDWKSIAQRLAAALHQLEAAKSSEDDTLAVKAEALQKHVEETLLEGQSFCFEHAVYQPTNLQRLFAAALDDGQSAVAAEDAQHWEAVADALHLSDSQLERLAAARKRFLTSIAEVCGERRQIFARLSAIEVPTSLRAMQHATAAWLEVHEATAELTANMNHEFCVSMIFVRDAFGYVLTPMQKAVAIVRSYPYFPDIFTIGGYAIQKQRPDLLLEGGEECKLLPAAGAAAAAGAPES